MYISIINCTVSGAHPILKPAKPNANTYLLFLLLRTAPTKLKNLENY